MFQLFSIGLVKLTDEGIAVTDSSGNVIETYTNKDIENFAKAWTGFVYTAARGNIEDRTKAAENKLDPMTIQPTYHVSSMRLLLTLDTQVGNQCSLA